MAIQFVGGNSAGKVGATSGTSTIALNSGLTGGIASSVSAGDLVIAVFGTGSTADRTLSITDGTSEYTLIGSELYSDDVQDSNLRVAYKFMGATPDTATTFGPTGDAADSGAMAVYVFRGVNQNAPLDSPTPVTATGGNTSRVVPPDITPEQAGSFPVVVGSAGHNGGVDTFTSSDLTSFLTQGGSDDTNDVTIGIGHQANWTSGATNYATWGHTQTDSFNFSWAAITFSLRPAWTFSDNFNRANSTNLGNQWSESSGSWQILSNQLRCDSGAIGAAFALHELKSEVQVSFKVVTTDLIGLYARVAGTDNIYAYIASGTGYIYEYVDPGPASLIASGSVSVSAGDTLALNCVGTNVRLLKNGASVVSGTTAVTQAGYTGAINIDSAGAADFDDYAAVDPDYFLDPGLFTSTSSEGYEITLTSTYSLTPALSSFGQTFYAPTVSSTYALTPSLYSNTGAFYAPTVAPGAVALTPTLVTNASTFYEPTVGRGAVGLTPTLYSNSQTFYAATVGRGAVGLTPSLYSNTNTFYAPTTTGTYSLTPGLVTNTGAFYAPTVGRGAVTLTPTLYSNTNTFYSPSVTRGTVTLTASLYSSTNTFYSPTVTRGTIALVVPLYSNANTFYSPTLTPGVVALTASLHSNISNFYAPSVTPGAVGLTASLYSGSQTFYAHTLTQGGPSVVSGLSLENISSLGYENVGTSELDAMFVGKGKRI